MRRIARVEHAVPVAYALVLAVVVLTWRDTPCSVSVPCGPQALRWVAFGALTAPVVMIWVHRWAAVVAAGACAVLWLAAFSGWTVLLAWAYAAVVWLVARQRRTAAPAPIARRRPVRPAVLPPVGRPAILLAVAGFVVAAATGAAVLWRQDSADRQQAAARVVSGVVREQPAGERALQVQLSDGETVRVGSLAPAAYPVGTPVQVALDGDGLRQLRSEPYDVTPWLALVVALTGLGAALLARAAQRRRELRLFFATPQPVRAVRVVDDFGYVHVLVPASDHHTAVEFGIDVADDGPPPEHDDEPVTVAATLYGEPAAGRWCAVEVDGRLRVPIGPVATTERIEYDEEHAVPQEVWDDDEQVVDPAQLSAYDRDASPDEVHEHRISPVRAWLETLLTGGGLALICGEVLSLVWPQSGRPLLVAIAAGSALGYEYGWRARLRPRLRWDVGGVAAVGFGHRDRQPWSVDSAALADGSGGVTLIAGDAVLTVAAPPPWPPWATQRTADQLVAALRFAQHRAVLAEHAPPPPEIEVPSRPPALYLAWAATILLAALLTG
jgi:hypothetical protein